MLNHIILFLYCVVRGLYLKPILRGLTISSLSSVRVGVVYLLTGFGGGVLSALLLKNTISVCASGALFGLLGSMLSELLTNWGIYSNKVNKTDCSFVLAKFAVIHYECCVFHSAFP